METIETLLITVHAAAALAALLSGLLSFRIRELLAVHFVAMVVMTATLIPAVVFDGDRVPTVARVVFGGLCALAVVMCISAWRAVRHRPRHGEPPDPRSTNSLTFGCIGLSVGFVAIALVGVDAPVVVIVAASVATVVAGRLLTHLLRPSATP